MSKKPCGENLVPLRVTLETNERMIRQLGFPTTFTPYDWKKDPFRRPKSSP